MFDCVNSQQLLPVNEYVPGAVLPPHLSPFVEEKEGDYIPPERKEMLEREKELLRTEAVDDVDEAEEEEVEEEDEEEEKEKVTTKSKKGWYL